jgi:putative heme-binding domain-containing protein
MLAAAWFLAIQMVVGADPTGRPKVTAREIEAGRALFQAQCAYCHGVDGAGGRGANLARPVLRRASTDDMLFRVVNRGIAGTGMPGNAMSAREVWQVVAYVRSLGRLTRQPLPGDPARGAEVYKAQGCAACHTVAGRGGPTGPDLTDVGARSSPAFLRRSLLDPAADLPTDFMQVRAVTKTGQHLSGVRVNEDTFSVQFRDASGTLHSYFKDQLVEFARESTGTPMPSYRERLEPARLDDLVAYLVSLEGTR